MADFGTHTLYLLLLLATWSGALGLVGARRRSAAMIAAARLSTYATAVVASLALVLLTYVFAVSDFSVKYVSQYSDRTMPLFFKLTAVWGGQAGSLLFWAWLLAVLSAWVVYANRRRLPEMVPWVIVVLMSVLVFFCLLLIFAGDPFATFLVDVPSTGRGLNPLLQNAYMVTHPPALYIGYVGMAVPFALAMAALITGHTDDAWISAARPFALGSWYFLTMGLVLGMLWAYEELGWGGYWAWDPVENAGLIPWLTATAYIHSVMVQQRRRMLKIWNMVLAILTFELTIFGTFLTRSGFIDSVHSFARSNIGWYFLGFMLLVAHVATGLIIWRRRVLHSRGELQTMLSREFFFVVNNWVLLSAAFLVMTLTIFPNISELLGDKITISAPAFNRWMIPIGLALLVLTGVGPMIAWRKSTLAGLRRQFLIPAAVCVILIAALAGLGVRGALPLVVFGLSGFTLVTVLQELVRGVGVRRAVTGADALTSLVGLVRRNRRRYGGYLVHAGVALMYIGFAGEAFKEESEVQLQPRQSTQVGHYILRFNGVETSADHQKKMATATLSVDKDGARIGLLHPARWIYFKHQDQPTTEVAIRRSILEDLFVALGDHDPQGGAATFKIVVNPLVNWIWFGFILLTLGALLAVIPYGLRRPARNSGGVGGLVLLGLVCGSLLIAPPAVADPGEPPIKEKSAAAASSVPTKKSAPLLRKVPQVERRLFAGIACMCPTCPRIPLASCQCGFAVKERAAIRQKLAKGWGEERILRWYKEQRGPELGREPFGQEALTTPPDSGFNRLSWLLPYLLSGLAVIVLVLAGLRWSRAGQQNEERPRDEGGEDLAQAAAPAAEEEDAAQDLYEDLLDRELDRME